MAGANVSGSFTLDITGDLLRSLASEPGNPFTQVQITLDNVSSWSVAESDFHLADSHAYLQPGTPVVDTSTGGKVVITVTYEKNIPEPATATLGLAALLGLMTRRRRRA